MDLHCIIVNWNTRDDLGRCLDALRRQDGLALGVTVVDNASRDGSAAFVHRRHRWVDLLPLGRNLGFAAANNLALNRGSARYRLLLNPDCLVHAGALAALVAYADAHPDAGLLGPRLLNGDGSLQASCRSFPTVGALFFRNTVLDRWFPRNRWTRAYLMAEWCHDRPREVDWLSGACVMARDETIRDIGGLDERFFMYCEDLDWCRRAHRSGWRVVYLPTAVATHLVGRSSDHRPAAMVREHHVSMMRYVLKHHGPAAAAVAAPLIALRYAAVTARTRLRF